MTESVKKGPRKGTCPSCGGADRWLGPWDGTGPGGHRELCGVCKADITLTSPGFRERFARAMGVPEGAVTVTWTGREARPPNPQSIPVPEVESRKIRGSE